MDLRNHDPAAFPEATTLACHPRPVSTLDEYEAACHDWSQRQHPNLCEAPTGRRLMMNASASTLASIDDVAYQPQA